MPHYSRLSFHVVYSSFGQRVIHGFCCFSSSSFGESVANGLGSIEYHLSESLKPPNFDHSLEEKLSSHSSHGGNGLSKGHFQQNVSSRKSAAGDFRSEAQKILEILHQDAPELDKKVALDDLQVRVTGLLVREVLLKILRITSYDENKKHCSKIGCMFFQWSGLQENYAHTTYSYHLMMQILSEAGEFKAMWELVDEMIENGYPTTARTFNILICACGNAGLARKVVQRFIKTKQFNYRPFKHSFNAILHGLLAVNNYKLIEWVYQQMLFEGHSPDILAYNALLCAKYRLRKLCHFHRLLDEMERNGVSPDFHTFNLLLHILGRENKPHAALNLLNHMKDIGCDPSVLHFTTLIDGLSRAGNLNSCKYFFYEKMRQCGCLPDVVCYTVMITGCIVAREFSKAEELFAEMVNYGQLPNVFTYNSMIRGLCMSGKFDEACAMLDEMESRGCNPNFLVYRSLVSHLQNAGELTKAHQVIRQMVVKGRYTHLVPRITRYRRP
ncbi:unnamed protein product [Cuscuta campestris]|uniref:Pentacotripeptide-repeat region of PRORP domain-containing protein n=2 Tax=Cuscuta sect. Cleistogrammica TaxID=1824901 RepID=A0A484KV02_9ASTE|nr:hypothetical protein DM860_014560 [Cuscuta australis]VFQ69130.1 unnamed protein product [Cuscuta campestris]